MKKTDEVRPLLVVKTGTISRTDIERVEQYCGFCIVESSEPDAVRFCEPPIDAKIDEQARAALGLLRYILNAQSGSFMRGDLTKAFVELLLAGRSVSSVPAVKRK